MTRTLTLAILLWAAPATASTLVELDLNNSEMSIIGAFSPYGEWVGIPFSLVVSGTVDRSPGAPLSSYSVTANYLGPVNGSSTSDSQSNLIGALCRSCAPSTPIFISEPQNLIRYSVSWMLVGNVSGFSVSLFTLLPDGLSIQQSQRATTQLVTTPLPASWVMFASALVLGAMWRRRWPS